MGQALKEIPIERSWGNSRVVLAVTLCHDAAADALRDDSDYSLKEEL
jgi:hypothetical protein